MLLDTLGLPAPHRPKIRVPQALGRPSLPSLTRMIRSAGVIAESLREESVTELIT